MDAQLEGHGIKLEYGQLVKEIQGNGKVEKIITNKGEFPAGCGRFYVLDSDLTQT